VGVINCFIQIVIFRNELEKQFITLTKTMKKIIPSAMRQKRRQVCGFLFAYLNVSDCFYDGLMPQTLLE
jgi:hypothetical protein